MIARLRDPSHRERFPVLVQMERYGDRKRTRVIRILVDDEDDWPQRPKGS